MMRTMNRLPDQAQGLLLHHNHWPPLKNSRHKARIGNRPKRKKQVGEMDFLWADGGGVGGRVVTDKEFFVHLYRRKRGAVNYRL